MSDEPKFGLSLPQILAGAAAAASAAYASSWLGVTGTVIGAAVMSAVASVASVLYGRSIEHSSERLRAAMPLRSAATVGAGSGAAGDTIVLPADPRDSGDSEDRTEGGLVDDAARGEAVEEEAPAQTAPRAPIRWRTVAVSAVATLVVGLGFLTGIEFLAGEAASVTGAGRDRQPTIVKLIQGDDSDNGTATGNDQGEDGQAPADTGSTTGPDPAETGSTAPEPTEPTESENTEPAPTDPAPTAPTPTDPTPTDPTPTDPAPTDPAPTDVEPTQTAPQQGGGTEPSSVDSGAVRAG
jgi:hypothetical protein